jgi:hypothetical protein
MGSDSIEKHDLPNKVTLCSVRHDGERLLHSRRPDKRSASGNLTCSFSQDLRKTVVFTPSPLMGEGWGECGGIGATL